MKLTHKALLLFVAICAISTVTKAAYMCCSLDTVALCGDECCKTECDSDGKCGCSEGEEWAYPGTHDFSDSLSPIKGKECCASENITYVQLSSAVTVPFCCWDGETYQTTKVNGKNIGACCSKTAYLKSLFIDNKYKSACCPNDGDHISVLDGNDNSPYCCPEGKSKTSDLSVNECCLDEDIYEENGTKKCCSSGKESEGCCKKKGGNWKNGICCSTTESNKTIDGTDNTSCGCAPTDYSESCCEENGGIPSHRMNVPQLDFLCCRSDGKTMQGDTISGCCMENVKKCSGSESHPEIMVCHNNMFSTEESCKKNYVCEENESEVKCVCPKKASDCTTPQTKFDEENCLCVCPDDKPLYNPSKNQCESKTCKTVEDCPSAGTQCFDCIDGQCVFKLNYSYCKDSKTEMHCDRFQLSSTSLVFHEWDCESNEVCVNGQCSSCPEGTTASDLDQSICCKNDKPGYFLYKEQEELATNGQMCGCPSPGSAPNSTSQWCCHDGKATTPGNASDNRINGEYKFVNNLTVQECGCPDGGDKKLSDNTYTCCKDGYEISVSDDSLTYAYNSVTASSIRLCQCPAGGTKGKLNDYCCKNGYGMKLTSGKEAVYPVDYSLYQRSSGMDIDTVKECGCPLLKDLVDDTCCDLDTGKAYNPKTDKYDTDDVTCCKERAEHNNIKECCGGSTPNKTTVLNGTDSYCCPNDKKDFVTAKGKCCSNSATYTSDKDCFCAKNPNDSKCSGGCETGYKKCPGEGFCVSESNCCPGDEYSGSGRYADVMCYTCKSDEEYQYNWWDSVYVHEDQTCCESKGKKWCAATEDYPSTECVDSTGENSCCRKDKPDDCGSRRCVCDNGVWKPASGYKQCKNGRIVSETTCCADEKPTEWGGKYYDSKCFDCNYDTGEYVLDQFNDVQICGCPDGGHNHEQYSGRCCKNGYEWNYSNDDYSKASWDCACSQKSQGESALTTDSTGKQQYCLICNGNGGNSSSVTKYTDYDWWSSDDDYASEKENCCSKLGGTMCKGEDMNPACIFGSNYKCCHDTLASGSKYNHVDRCCLSSLPEGLVKQSCYSCSKEGSWEKDSTGYYYKEEKLQCGSSGGNKYPETLVVKRACDGDKAKGLYEYPDGNYSCEDGSYYDSYTGLCPSDFSLSECGL